VLAGDEVAEIRRREQKPAVLALHLVIVLQ
jgi:hypothetical protein